jgi:hypothetical protein
LIAQLTIVTFKIETMPRLDGIGISRRHRHLGISRLRAQYLSELKAKIDRSADHVVLEMDQVTFVDVKVVGFLGNCETQGVEPLYLPS